MAKSPKSPKHVAHKSPAKRTGKPARAKDLAPVYSALKGLLAPYEDRLVLKTANSGYCFLESRTPTYKNRPMFFAGVREGKNYVSYHLMPVAGNRELLDGMSPELRKRMQGKACFNFISVEPGVFAELARLTQASFEKFKSLNYL